MDRWGKPLLIAVRIGYSVMIDLLICFFVLGTIRLSNWAVEYFFTGSEKLAIVGNVEFYGKIAVLILLAIKVPIDAFREARRPTSPPLAAPSVEDSKPVPSVIDHFASVFIVPSLVGSLLCVAAVLANALVFGSLDKWTILGGAVFALVPLVYSVTNFVRAKIDELGDNRAEAQELIQFMISQVGKGAPPTGPLRRQSAAHEQQAMPTGAFVAQAQ